MLDDLVARNLATPELLIVDGAPGLEAAIAALWAGVPVQRCTVHKERNLLAHAPKALHEEIKADYSDIMYAKTAGEAIAKRKAFLKKWRGGQGSHGGAEGRASTHGATAGAKRKPRRSGASSRDVRFPAN